MKIKVSPIHCNINNVFIHVSNLQKSVKWYSNLLGLSYTDSYIESPVYNITVTGETGLSLDDQTFDPGFKLKPSNHVLFNFYVDDIDVAYKFMKENHIIIVKEIEQINDFAYFNFQDPDGNVLMACNC